MIWVCSEVFEKAVLGSEGAGCWGVIGCDQGMDGWMVVYFVMMRKKWTGDDACSLSPYDIHSALCVNAFCILLVSLCVYVCIPVTLRWMRLQYIYI